MVVCRAAQEASVPHYNGLEFLLCNNYVCARAHVFLVID